MRFKELKVVEIPKWGTYLREQWRESFARHLTNAEQKLIGMDGFLWHLCSWEKVKCFEKDEAIAAFNKQSKFKCTIFYQFIDEAYLLENAKTLTVEELPYDKYDMDYCDIYIMDWNYKWTFIITHESDLGPYFIQKF
ncbi:DUF4275 family protein [Lysinibacillus telephonicus]|uniref:DUF4275 family protein n=1 Tax=Lysinibacillus telephonicus TaxID=1714840 RepID=A0A431UEB3_9BACI|nr:DUF4275 family protein [Lysinibacillus telephonicus]RTQ87630.1 DUF4275 family protein [Lysinibacillus telephonicus]